MTINGLSCKVVERQGKKTEVEIAGQKIFVSSDFIPKKATAGFELKLYFLDCEDAKLSEKQLAKSILEQILNGE